MSKLGPTDQVYEQFKKKLQPLTIIIGLEFKYPMETCLKEELPTAYENETIDYQSNAAW